MNKVIEVGENLEGAVVKKGELLLKIDDFEQKFSDRETAKLEV